jgi:type I restriction enzyme S subunit
VFTSSPVRSAEAGDILVSVRAPVGDVNIADEPICIGRGIASVRSTRGKQATLFHQLKAERGAWEPFEAEGTVFGSINRDQLHAIQLREVDPSRAARVEEQLSAIESMIAATLAENRTLTATRDALLPQLMSGKLRVRDAEAAASDVGA